MSGRAAPIETLRISGQDRSAILKAVDPGASQTMGGQSGGRGNIRVITNGAEAVLGLEHDSMSPKRFSVLAHNLSRRGVGVIHGRFVYPGTPCEIELYTLRGDLQPRRGSVIYCKHVTGLIHEMGIRFESQVDIRDFVRLSPEQEARFLKEMAEHMPAEQQDGGKEVLVIDDFASDLRLFSHWLSKGGFNAQTLTEYDEASTLDAIEEQRIDLLLIDYHLGIKSGGELIRVIRSAGCRVPILAMSADDDQQTPDDALTAGADGFIRKPFTKEQLLKTVKKLLDTTADTDFEPIYSTLKGDEEMQPLLADFARGLPDHIGKISKANAKHDYDTLERLVYSLKSVGTGYGFNAISENAADVMQALNAEMADMDQITEQVNYLIETLNRVRVA